tara:strand:+ start:30 stop:1199 length:1170 start_codon:yes stop_codon:yes gene_type:complete
MKFSIVGAGYVGLSLAVLIAQKYEVNILDINEKKILSIKNKKSPFRDSDIEDFLINKKLNLNATADTPTAYKDSDFVIVATPTNYDIEKGKFDTVSVEKVIEEALSINPDIYIVIKSTVPLGFTSLMRSKLNTKNICFSPEFLREGSALHDNLYPSRIIIGDNQENAKIFANVLSECSFQKGKENKIFYMESSEAEAVKLFSNTYLAMRVSFFNELDSFSQIHNLSSENIVKGVSADSRIGNYYNNPSFGYGGYCLPKDTKQLLNNFNDIPNNLISAIIDSNETRKNFIAKVIIDSKPKSVGVYKLSMKSNSDNFRESAVFDIIKKLQANGIKIYVYEPELNESLDGITKISNFEDFITASDKIIANRISADLIRVKDKVFTRDLFGEN